MVYGSKYKMYAKMVETVRKNMRNANVYRLDVRFNITGWNMNTFVGRAAHIMFLKDELLIRMILLHYKCFCS